MGRCYSVLAHNITVAGATTLVLIRPPATGVKHLEFYYAELTFKGVATSAQEHFQVGTVTYAGGPTLASATPEPLDLSIPASQVVGGTTGAAGTAGVNATAEGTPTRTVKHTVGFNVLNGGLWTPLEEDDRIIIPVNSASAFFMRFPTAPANTAGWHPVVKFREG